MISGEISAKSTVPSRASPAESAIFFKAVITQLKPQIDSCFFQSSCLSAISQWKKRMVTNEKKETIRKKSFQEYQRNKSFSSGLRLDDYKLNDTLNVKQY